MSESQLVSAIIKRLWYERGWISIDRANSGTKIFKDSSGKKQFIRGHRAGTPDLIGYMVPHGRSVGLEVKLPGKKQQPSQIEFEADMKSKGAVYLVVTSLDEIEEFIKQYKPC